MKRSILAVAAVLALGSVSAYAQTAGVQPSFKDYTDLGPATLTSPQAFDQHFPKGSMNGGGGPTGPATVIVQGNDRVTAQYAHANIRGTRTDAQDGSEENVKLNDTFNYPAY